MINAETLDFAENASDLRMNISSYWLFLITSSYLDVDKYEQP